MGVKIQLLRGTEADWSTKNPTLDAGQPGFEIDTFKLKIGDGLLAWNDLPYISGGMGGDNGPLQYTINGLYLVANVDGTVLSSTNGIDWSDPFDTTIDAIGKFTIGPSKIVYTRSDVEEQYDTGLYFSSLWNEIPTLATGTDNYYFNEVHYLNNLYIAVGSTTDTPRRPVHAYSSNAINWTVLEADEAFCNSIAGANNFKFNDIGYNGTGYFIISSIDGMDNGGGFYILDITQPVSGDHWVDLNNFPTDANQLVYFGGDLSWGKWSAFSDDKKTWWSTSNEDPSEEWGFIDGWNLSNTIFQEATGLDDLSISEATIGVLKDSTNNYYVTWMVSTYNGQIVWWPNVPAGPYVSVPKPYTATVATIEDLNELTVTFTSITGTPQNNEKITISGATGLSNLNGEYFVENIYGLTYKLHSSVALNNPVDASGWSGTYVENSAIATLSRGTFIDGLGYGNNKFFAANDNEEIFVCSLIDSNGNLVWTQVDDRGDDFAYWNDIDFGALGSGNSDMIIDFNSNQIKLNEISNNINFSNYFDFIKDNNYTVTLRVTNKNDGSFEIFMSNTLNYSEPYYVFDITKIVDNNLSYENDNEYYVNIDIIGSGGSFTIPTANIDLHNGGVQSAQVLQFNDATKQSVITGPTPQTNNDAQRLILQGQKGQGNGEGGDVYVWGGDGDTNGGDIKIYAGDADNGSSGSGGYINITGGQGFDNGGNITINGGTSNNNPGQVYITSNNNEWIFRSDGELKLDHGIVFGDNSTQTTAASNVVDDALNTTLVAGDGINLDYNSGTDTLTINSNNTIATDTLEPDGFVNRTDSEISFDNNTATFSIGPKSPATQYIIYNNGTKVIKNSVETLTLPNSSSVTALYYIHFDKSNNSLSYKTTGFDFSTDIPIAHIYWNHNVLKAVYFGEERHGVSMDTATHTYLHNVMGTQYVNGLSISNYTLSGNGSNNSDATIAISDGLIYDEDIQVNITHSNSPSNPFEQILYPIAQIPVYYKDGSNGEWNNTTVNDYPVKTNTTIQYNLDNAGTWSAADSSNPTNNRFIAYWICATSQESAPIISIMGQRIDSSLNQATSNNSWSNLNLTGLPIVELRPLYRIIYDTNSNLTNSPKGYLVDILDIRGHVDVITGVIQNDHGSLYGLADDDHYQYVHIDNARNITAVHTFTNGLNTSNLTLDNGYFSNTGDAQFSMYVLKNTTNSSGWNSLYLDYNTNSQEYINIDNATATFSITISVRNSSAFDSGGFIIRGCVKKISSTVSLVGSPVIESFVDSNFSTANVQILTSGPGLIIQVDQGSSSPSGTNYWIANVQMSRITI